MPRLSAQLRTGSRGLRCYFGVVHARRTDQAREQAKVVETLLGMPLNRDHPMLGNKEGSASTASITPSLSCALTTKPAPTSAMAWWW